MDWSRILKDGIVPILLNGDSAIALDDSLYHETRKQYSPASKSKIILPLELDEDTVKIEEQEEKLVRRMKKGKSRAVMEQDETYALVDEMALSKFWVKPETPFPYPFSPIGKSGVNVGDKVGVNVGDNVGVNAVGKGKVNASERNIPEMMTHTNPKQNQSFEDLLNWFDEELKKNLPEETIISIKPSLIEIIERGESMERLQSDLMDLIGFEHWTLLEAIIERCEALRLALRDLKVKEKQKTPMQSMNSLAGDNSKRSKKPDLKVIRNSVNHSGNPLNLPHIYNFERLSSGSNNALLLPGQKFSLPANTERKDTFTYELFKIPYSDIESAKAKFQVNIRTIEQNFPKQFWPCFHGYEALNRMQSLVYPVAFGSNNNMLVCAPTGAGKTDVALMTVLKTFELYGETSKIVYIAPMKALASEVTRKFRKKLKSLSLNVEEWTGDMSLTLKQISETFMFVTTPEKWDVVTRRPLEQLEFAQSVRSIIIDEVHLLQDERGSVLESIVARTLRQIEMTQQVVRLVGLSATLPNYMDVSQFLRVNPKVGLFYFDSSFRPVPLEQRIFGIKGRSRTMQYQNMNRVAFEQCMEYVKDGFQVMVFVHSRNDTNKTARTFLELMTEFPDSKEIFSIEPLTNIAGYGAFQQNLHKFCRNKQIKELFKVGFTIHHAGILRGDRNLVEEMFEKGYARVLFCTSTLAWGVNLPAHAVIIRGTEIYDPNIGSYTQLSILDVLQIFGRAGRPQYEDHGVGILLTPQSQLHTYLRKLTLAAPIESQFMNWDRLVMNLNAEISASNIENMTDALSWMRYTFAHVRMTKNPLVYGISVDERDLINQNTEPYISEHVRSLLDKAALLLSKCQMISYDPKRTDLMRIREPGRIASQFYLHYETIELFLKTLQDPDNGPICEMDVFVLLSKCKEWDSLQLRESDVKQLSLWFVEYAVLVEQEDSAALYSFDQEKNISLLWQKVLILLQTMLSSHNNPSLKLDEFSLISDLNYVSSNVGRISAGLVALALYSGNLGVYELCLSVDKSIRNCTWSHLHPLSQFAWKPRKQKSGVKQPGGFLDFDDKNFPRSLNEITVYSEDYKGPTALSRMSIEGVADYFGTTPRIAENLKKISRFYPEFECQVRNVSFVASEWTKLQVEIWRDSEKWNKDDNERIGGIGSHSESGIIFIFDGSGGICQSRKFSLNPRKPRMMLEFFVKIGDGDLWLKWISDRWLHCEADESIPIHVNNGYAAKDFEMNITHQILELEPVRDCITGDRLDLITSQAYFGATAVGVHLYFQSGPGPWEDDLVYHAMRSFFNSNSRNRNRPNSVKYVCGRAERVSMVAERICHVFGKDVLEKQFVSVTSWSSKSSSMQKLLMQETELLILDDLTQVLRRGIPSNISDDSKVSETLKIIATSPVPIYGLDGHLDRLFGQRIGQKFQKMQFGWKIRQRPLQVHLETFMVSGTGTEMISSDGTSGKHNSNSGLGSDIIRSIYRHIVAVDCGGIVLWTVSKKMAYKLALNLISLSSFSSGGGSSGFSGNSALDAEQANEYLESIRDPLLKHVMGFGIVMIHGDLCDSDLQIALCKYSEGITRLMIIVNSVHRNPAILHRLEPLSADLIIIQDTKEIIVSQRNAGKSQSNLASSIDSLVSSTKRRVELELCDLMRMIDTFCRKDPSDSGADSALIRVVLCCSTEMSDYYRFVLQSESFQRLPIAPSL